VQFFRATPLSADRLNRAEPLVLLVGRPGLDPGTLGRRQGSPPPTTEVRLFWSEPSDCPPPTAQEHLDLLLRLQVWLQTEVGAERGVILSTGPTGVTVEVPMVRSEGFEPKPSDP